MSEVKASVKTGQLRAGECIEVVVDGERLRVCKVKEGAREGEITIEKVSE
ncbi:MAG: hypothetical protein QIT33_gp11 [Methanophagales virus PBV300]|uniref:Uncharacterized protein n=1 Tax=Methanophagales virus PBV300 TaxID=2987731 RepID=A0ABY6GMY9_9VIRU|nr:MAG: hypothetical protein QIT33_gp11 [Methanophagales virus PBV300]UYL64973.1 MAG: hypothetical protein JBCDKDKM_00011 [Methanophagales virus PBV300]